MNEGMYISKKALYVVSALLCGEDEVRGDPAVRPQVQWLCNNLPVLPSRWAGVEVEMRECEPDMVDYIGPYEYVYIVVDNGEPEP